MNDKSTSKVLGEIVCSVLEQTAFLFPEPADLSKAIASEKFDFMAASMAFSGDHDGEVMLMVPKGLCHEIVTNMLGEEALENGNQDSCRDAAKEVLNIIAGQLLTRLYGRKALFEFCTPQIREIPHEELAGLVAGGDYFCSTVEEYPVLAALVLHERKHERSGAGR